MTKAAAVANTPKKAIVEWNAVKGRWEATHNGQVLVKGANVNYVVDVVRSNKNPKCRALGITDVVGRKDGSEVDVSVFFPPSSRGSKASKEAEQDSYLNDLLSIDIEERMKNTRRVVQMVLADVQHSAIVSGPGGLGKSYLVLEEVEKAGLKPASYMIDDGEGGGQATAGAAKIDGDESEEVMEKAIFDASEVGGDYIHIKGFSTARSLYRLLFKYRFKLVIFDDCDSIQKDPTAINILKAVLDTGKERWVHWMSQPVGGDDIPPMFQFHGRVIFISNLAVDKIDQALRTRAMMLDLSMTAEQKMKYMKSALKKIAEDHPEWLADGSNEMAYINESYEFLDGIKDKVKELNFRTLLGIIKIRVHQKKEWKDLAEYVAKFGFR